MAVEFEERTVRFDGTTKSLEGLTITLPEGIHDAMVSFCLVNDVSIQDYISRDLLMHVALTTVLRETFGREIAESVIRGADMLRHEWQEG